MAHNVEPMDIDNIEGDFDNKENTFHHTNVLPRTPCTEKGYEELDVSELNMKLRYSITPASSPMSKSYTAHCLDNRKTECPENSSNSIENANLTRSFNSTLTKNDSLSKSSKLQPLHLHMADPSLDNNRNTNVLRPLDTTITETNNITVTVSLTPDIDENFSLPSSSSSALHTPEATTPTKEITKTDGGSPIMRGLKSVLNMFRASQSPIPPAENEDNMVKHDISSPVDLVSSATPSDISQVALASTPIATRKQRESSSKRASPLKESIVFNEDLEKELLWKDETTILFSEEKIPIHKLFFQQSKQLPLQNKEPEKPVTAPNTEDSLNETVEFMDVSYNDSIAKDKTISELNDAPHIAESDGEFVDCETTFTQQSDEEHIVDDKENTPKAAQQSQTTNEEFNKKPVDTMYFNEISATVTQDEFIDKNIQEPYNDSKELVNSMGVTQSFESNAESQEVDGSSSLQSGENMMKLLTCINITQDINTHDVMPPLDATLIIDEEGRPGSSIINTVVPKCNNKSREDIEPTDVTAIIESNDKPVSVSTFIMNSAQNITTMDNNLSQHTTVGEEENHVSPSTYIMNGTQNFETLLAVETINKQVIVSKEAENEPVFSADLIMNPTQMNDQQKEEKFIEHVKSTVLFKSNYALSPSKDINDVVQVIEAQSNNNVMEKPLDVTTSSSDAPVSFIMNASTDKNNELLDSTVTIEMKNIPASSTFIKDITQDIEAQMSGGDNVQTALNRTIFLESENKPISSSTFVKDLCADLGKEYSKMNIATDSVQAPILTSTITKEVTQDIESQSRTSDNLSYVLNSTLKDVKGTTKDMELCATSQCLNASLPADKMVRSSIDAKSITQQILDSQAENDSVVIDIGVIVNTEAIKQPEKSGDDFEIPCSVIDTQLTYDIFRPLNSTLPIAKLAEISSTVIHNDPQNEIEIEDVPENVECDVKLSPAANPSKALIDNEKKQIINDQIKLNDVRPDQVDCNDMQSLKLDLLNSSGDATKKNIDDLALIRHSENVLNKVIEPLRDIGCGEQLPVNIPLPDDDIEPLSTVQLSVNDNAANSEILPDVINDLESSKIQHANRIDEVPIKTVDHVEAPTLVINTLNIKIEESNENQVHDCKAIETENNKTCFIDIEDSDIKNNKSVKNSSNNVESIIIPAHFNDSPAPDECVDFEKQYEKISETKSEDRPELMDISYNTCGLSAQKDYVFAGNDNVTTTVVHDEIKSFNQNISNENKDRPDNIPTVVDEAKLDLDTNIGQETNLSDMNVLQCVTIEDMENATPARTSTIEGKITQLLQSVPDPESDVDMTKRALHEEFIVSENNSPYVLVSVDKDAYNKLDSSLEEDFEKLENPFASKAKMLPPPPSSPPIASKGYNFNFDEMDDPFATKTKIRTSPPVDSPKQVLRSEEKKQFAKKEPVNRCKRKSYPVRPRPVISKKNFNSTFDVSSPPTVKDIPELDNKANDLDIHNVSNLNKTIATKSVKVLKEYNEDPEVVEKSELENNTDNASKVIGKVVIQNEVRNLERKSEEISTTPSSSDQSVYLSAAASSAESITAKNVFNLPEIEDMNFNPFATKSKIRSSPPPSLENDDEIKTQTKSDIQNTTLDLQELSPPKNSNVTVNLDISHNASVQNKSEHEETNCSNASNTTCSSKDDKNTTVREVHTDNEDTIEGPFLENEDNEEPDLGLLNSIRKNEMGGLDLQNDLMEFSHLPTQENEDNELFIDAAAYEFLLNQNQSNVVVDSGKESLFLKFDPLFAKRLSSEGIAAALSKIQKRQSTPKKMLTPLQAGNTDKAVAGPSTSKISPHLNNTEDITEDLNITTSKPMMVVTPAVNPIVTPRKSTTPTSSNRRSITFTSPAIAVIDRLLSLSANNSLIDQNTTITQVSREQNEAELALIQLRELLAEKEINVCNLRSESKELRDRLTTLESQMKVLETESEERLKKVNELNEKLTEKTKINKSMAAVVEEYERTIASLIAETEQDRKLHDEERASLIKERDEQTAHLASMEVSFSDLHSKYEKSKQIILSCKANEEAYKKSIKDFEDNLTKMQNNYELLKQHATSKLNHANQELEKMNRAHESEVLKLNAMVKRKEMHITSLEETLAQKTKANEELTAICDELINKVG